jgi:hypothetical protein
MTPVMELPVLETVATGLCTACANAPTCTHARIPGVPVVSCDDAAPLAIAVAPATGVEARPPRAHVPRAGATGLCATCVRFSDCTYPKPETGVWRCEEFE